MTDFLQFVEYLRHSVRIHVEISYCSVTDWIITVYRKGCADEYPKDAPTCHGGADALMCYVSDPDMELCFAKAHVALKEWLREYHSGY